MAIELPALPLQFRPTLARVRVPGPTLVILGVWVVLLGWYGWPTVPRFWAESGLPPGQGVYVREMIAGRPASFTRGHARWPLPESLGPSQAVLLTFQARTPFDAAQRPTQVWLSYQSFVRFDVTPEWRSYAVLLPQTRPARGDTWLVLDTDAQTFGNDPRAIGLVLRQVLLNGFTSYRLSGTDSVLLLAALVFGMLLLVRLGQAPLLSIAAVGLGLFSLRVMFILPPLLLVAALAAGGYGTLHGLPALRGWRRHRLRYPRVLTLLVVLVALVLVALALFHPSRLRLTVQLVGLVAAAYALLLYAGFGITWFLRSRRLAPILPLFTPVVGMAAISAIGHWLGYLPWGTNQTGWPIMLLFTVINVLAWRQGARPTLPRRYRLALVGGMVGLVAGLLPFCMLGYLTTVGTTIDAIAYLTRADYIQTSGLRTLPDYADGIPNSSDWARSQLALGIREGDAFQISLLSSLVQTRAYLVFPILMAVWYTLPPVAVFIMIAHHFRLSRSIALTAALLVAVQPLTHWPLLEDHLSQVAGTAAWLFGLMAIFAALRSGEWRTMVLAGLLFAGLATFYPVYVVYMLPVIGLLGCYEWMRQATTVRQSPSDSRYPTVATRQSPSRKYQLAPTIKANTSGRGYHRLRISYHISGIAYHIPRITYHASHITHHISRIMYHVLHLLPYAPQITRLAIALLPVLQRGILFLVATLLINPIGWQMLVQELTLISRATGGSILTFPHPGEIIGLVNHATEFLKRAETLPRLPALLTDVLFSMCLAFMLYALVRSRGQQRWLLGSLLFVFIGALLHMRFVTNEFQGYPYGYFKVATLFTPIAVMGLVCGTLTFYQKRQCLVQSPPMFRWIAQIVPPLLLGICFAASTVHTVTATDFNLRHHLMADTALIEATEAMAFVPANEPLLMIEPRAVKPNWLSYLLNHPLTFFRTPLRHYGSPNQAHCPLLVRFALLSLVNTQQGYRVPLEPWQATEPWGNATTYRVLWHSREFMLLRRTDEPLADIPLALARATARLNTPISIKIAHGRMYLSGDSISRRVSAQQFQIDEPPAFVEVTIQSTTGGQLTLKWKNTRQQVLIQPGTQRIRIPIEDGVLNLWLQQQRQPKALLHLATVQVFPARTRSIAGVDE